MKYIAIAIWFLICVSITGVFMFIIFPLGVALNILWHLRVNKKVFRWGTYFEEWNYNSDGYEIFIPEQNPVKSFYNLFKIVFR